MPRLAPRSARRDVRRFAPWLPVMAIALLAALAACAMLPPSRPPLGLDVGWVVDDSGTLLMTPDAAAKVSAAGAGLARVEFRTGPFFGDGTGPGVGAAACPFAQALCDQRRRAGWTAFYAAYDQVVRNLTAQHVQVLGLLDGSTVAGGQGAWTADNAEHDGPSGGTGANAYTAAFAPVAADIMAHYRGRIRYWEIWNEPNAWTKSGAGGTYSGGSFMYPSNYAALLQATYHAAKEVRHLPVTIISGGVFGHSIGGIYTAQNAGADYLRQVFGRWRSEGLARFPLDAVGQHLYISQGGAVSAAQVARYLNWVHAVPAAYGLPKMPTFVTELGWTTGSVSAAVQGANLTTALGAARAAPYVATVVVFNLRHGPGLDYGVYTASWQPTPALEAFRRAAQGWRGSRA